MRSLAADLGALLGGGAHLRKLRREAVGEFSIEEAVTLEALEALASKADALIAPAEALRGLSRAVVGPPVQTAVGYGQVVAVEALHQAGGTGPGPVGRGRRRGQALGRVRGPGRGGPSRRWCCRRTRTSVRSGRGGRPTLKPISLRLLFTAAALCPSLAFVTAGPAAATSLKAFSFTGLTVTPHRGLVDGQQVTVHVTGGSYRKTNAVVDCDPKAH